MTVNETNCPCKKNCERHGKCDECREYHDNSKRKRLPACDRKTIRVKKEHRI